jgi:archaellum component FlaC
VSKYVIGLVSALAGVLGTMGAAILRARNKGEANNIEAARVASQAQERAIETLQARVDTLDSRLNDAEQAEERCRERLREERKQRERLEATVEKLEATVEEVHRQYDALVGRIEEDSAVDWNPHEV